MIIEWLQYVLAGAGVGLLVGLTGVGGGSLMTPLLLALGIPAHTAVGTDLLYAAVTKGSGAISHHIKRNINWRITLTLAAGSIPASIITIFILKHFFHQPEEYKEILTFSLGIMLVLTSSVLLLRNYLIPKKTTTSPTTVTLQKHATPWTFFMGVLLGIFVTLSSVGAGAFGAAILLTLYPRLSTIKIIGTDIAHAVPLTLIAGLGHLYLGNIDFNLLTALLIGSVPAIHLGIHFAHRIPDKIMQPLLATVLLLLGLKYIL